MANKHLSIGQLFEFLTNELKIYYLAYLALILCTNFHCKITLHSGLSILIGCLTFSANQSA